MKAPLASSFGARAAFGKPVLMDPQGDDDHPVLGLDVISFGEPAVADQCAREACEGEEVLGFALVATMKTTASSEPGHRAFDGPAVLAETLRGLDSLASYAVLDTPPG